MVPLLIGLGYVALYIAGGWLLRDLPMARAAFGNVGLLLPPGAVCAVILRRRHTWFGCQRLFWDTFGIGAALWMIGHAGWAFAEVMQGHSSWLQWHTVFTLCGGIGPLIALFARPHRGVRSDAVAHVSLVLASYVLLSFFIYSYFALIPSLVLDAPDADITLFRLVQVNRALLFIGMVAATYVARRTPWRDAFGYLALATGLGFFLRLITSQAIVRGAYQIGTPYDLAWIVPFLLYTRAAAEAPESPAESGAEVDALTASGHAALAAVAIFLIPLIGYGATAMQPLGGMADSFRTLLTGLMTVAGLGVLALRVTAQQGEIQRADARIQLLAAATEQTGDLILVVRADGAFEYANDAFLRATGYSPMDLSRQSFPDLIEEGIESDIGLVRAEIRERGLWRGTRRRRGRNGSTRPVSCAIVGLKRGGGAVSHFVAVERDITEELRLRDQLVHSERLSAIGELVAGVAHEINNPLQTIVGSVELMLSDYPDAPSRSDLELVRRQATRAGHIVRNLLSFVRRSAPNRSVVDLNDIARATADLREYHLRQHNIALALDLQPEAAMTLVDREEIQQVALNLMLNAEHAIRSESMPGTITIRTITSNGEHLLEVTDTGPGVGAEYQGRIFEPFFTTKEVGEGTGLGLSISHGIAAAHGGSLTLCPSTIGACFRLTLPANATAAPGPLPLAAELSSGTVALVVDDEAPIRELVARLLRKNGMEVLEAEGAEAALALAGQRAIGLVVCDVRMSGLGGAGLYERLSSEHPALGRRFVFITGDRSTLDCTSPAIAHVPVLEKPFTAEGLRMALARIAQAH